MLKALKVLTLSFERWGTGVILPRPWTTETPGAGPGLRLPLMDECIGAAALGGSTLQLDPGLTPDWPRVDPGLTPG